MPCIVAAPLRQITIALLLFSACSFATATELVRPRPLTEYHDLLLAQELDTALNALNERVKQCVDSGTGSPSACVCRYPEEAGAAKLSYEKVLQERPKWKGKILYWKNPENQASHNLVMPAIDQQLLPSALGCSSTPQ